MGSTIGNSGSAATAGLQRLVPMIPDPVTTEAPDEQAPTPGPPRRQGPLPTHLLPLTAEVGSEGQLRIGGVDVLDIVEEVGTPVFIYDEEHLRRRCQEARQAFGPRAAYASKAFLCKAMAALAYEEGLCIDVSTGGELAVALAAGVPGERLVLHGNNKSEAELEDAIAAGVGLDWTLTRHFAVRLAQIDYLMTRFYDPFGSRFLQNNARYSGGLVFRF